MVKIDDYWGVNKNVPILHLKKSVGPFTVIGTYTITKRDNHTWNILARIDISAGDFKENVYKEFWTNCSTKSKAEEIAKRMVDQAFEKIKPEL